MERLKEAVLRHARNQPEGVPLTAKGLLHLVLFRALAG